MNGKIINLMFVLLIFALTNPAQISSGGSFSLEKSVIAGGGGESTSNAFTVAGTSAQNAAGTFTQNSGFFQIGGFWTDDRLAPTSARVSISGKVTTLKGGGIRNVIVTLTDSEGRIRTAATGSFGAFGFTDIEVGHAYIVRVQAKKYFFSNPTQILIINDSLTDINFTAEDL